jgi:hypothetical protein
MVRGQEGGGTLSLARIPFTKADEDIIRSLCGWMLFVTIVVNFIAFGFACLLGVPFGGLAAVRILEFNTVAGIVQLLAIVFLAAASVSYIYQGVVLVQTRSELMAVVTTDQADQAHLAAAFRKLRLVFLIEVIFAVLSVLLNLVQLVSALVSDVPAGGFPGMGGPGGGGYGGGYGGGM